MTDYSGLIKKLQLPPGYLPPARLTYEDVVATAITRADLQEDVRGINASIELIHRTRGGRWPTEPVTEEYNFVDLVWHELEFREGTSFTYAVYDADGGYLGCCYLYPMGGRTPLTPEVLHHDVDVSWWVTPAAYERGYYERVHRALRHWLAEELPFSAPYFSNAVIPGDELQVQPC
jgi:RimJ/RimL family protein N-acetyltransferase